MKVAKCRDCGELLRVDESASRVECPGCARTYTIRQPVEKSPDAERKGEVRADGISRRPERTSRSRGLSGRRRFAQERPRARPARGTEYTTAQRARFGQPSAEADGPTRGGTVQAVVTAAGALMVLAAAILFAAGPFVPAHLDPEILGPRTKELAAKVEALERQVAERHGELERLRVDLFVEEKRSELLVTKQDELHRREREISDARMEIARERVPATPAVRSSEKVIQKAVKAVLVIETDRGSGSGFVIRESGLAVTNYHVIRGSTASHLKVSIQRRGSSDPVDLPNAKIVAVDPENDLALIRLPEVPDSVAVNGKYPVAPLREKPAQQGEDVFAIGNPGVAGAYSVTSGIVSHPDRDNMIQTSAVVYPGNSGGPLFDEKGAVLGVVTLKALWMEAVTLAVPGSTLQKFWRHAREKPYRVHGSLSEWEKRYSPVAQLFGPNPLWGKESELELPGLVTAIESSPDGRRLFLAAGSTGKVWLFLTDQRKLGKKPVFSTDGFILDMALGDGNRKDGSLFLAVVSRGDSKSRVVRLDSSTLRRDGEVELRGAPRVLSYLGTTMEWLMVLPWFGQAEAAPFLLSRKDYLPEGPQGLTVSYYKPDTLDFACNTDWIAAAERQGENEVRIRVLPKERGVSGLIRVSGTSKRRFAERLRKDEKTAVVPRRMAAPPITFAGRERLIYGRSVFRLDRGLELEGEFEPSRFDRRPENLAFASVLDNIVSVSRDGEWAASGSHIYDVSTRKIVRRLPTLSIHQAFSANARSLYLVDYSGRYLYELLNWRRRR